MRYRFTFRFVRSEDHSEQELVIMGTHFEDAKLAAWTVLGEMSKDHAPRTAWRLVSSMQESLLAVAS